MTGGKGFEVTADALVRHAGSVEAVAGEVDTARAAAATVQMGREAYGKLPVCQMIPMLLDPLQGRAVAALAAADDALRSAADTLRVVSRGYAASDEAAANRFGAGGAR